MSQTPPISIVIPLLNKAPQIVRTLKSILTQTFQDFEVIVVDGGSTDNGLELINEFEDPRIRIFKQKSRGVSAARNEGVERAAAGLIAFLDADDEWTPKHLETLLRLRRKHPQAGLYGTAYYISDGSIREARLSPQIPKWPWEGIIDNYWKTCYRSYSPPFWTSCVAVPKQVFEEMSGFNPLMNKGEDLDLWGRIALQYKVAFSRDGMGIYHYEGDDHISKNDNGPRSMPSGIVVSAWKALDAGEVPSDLRKDLIRHIEDIQISWAWINMGAGRPDLARLNIKKLRTKRRWRSAYWALLWTYVPPTITMRINTNLLRLI